MEQKAGAQISAKAFIQSVVILVVLMLIAGTLTRIIPAGSYARITQGDREIIDPQSFQFTARPAYPIWRWATAPIEVLWGPEGLTIIVIIIFLLMVGVAFAILDKSGILQSAVTRIVTTFGGKKYLLLLALSLFFMILGAFFGVFEEVVPLIPLMIALSHQLGWDSLVGLGMSILATNMGFSAAITNPFSIGVAQEIAGLPIFSGSWLRVPIFLVMYAILAVFLVRYAKKVEADPSASLVFEEDKTWRAKTEEYTPSQQTVITPSQGAAKMGKAIIWFLAFLALILLVLIGGPFIPGISDFALPLAGLLFLIGGVGAGLICGMSGKATLKAAIEGASGIAPGIPLILMASSIKHIVTNGGIMDTMLHSASDTFGGASPFLAILIVYVLALLFEIFIGSASAKAFLLMPILLPLAELVGVTRQITVLAYCFGDGFTNLAYPTNPVLLISLGLTSVTYAKWFKWSLKMWAAIIITSIAFLGLAVAINFGPF